MITAIILSIYQSGKMYHKRKITSNSIASKKIQKSRHLHRKKEAAREDILIRGKLRSKARQKKWR